MGDGVFIESVDRAGCGACADAGGCDGLEIAMDWVRRV
jgi:hypothetical protein